MFDSLSWTQFFTQFHFIRPLWLLALIPMFFLVWLRWREESKPSWKDILPEHLRNALTIGERGWRKQLPLKLLMLIVLIAIVICAGPTWQRESSPFGEDKASLLVVLDNSDSMLQKDLPPSRLERSKQKIRDLLVARKGGKTGLVVFAGSAHVAMPVTQDSKVFNPFLAAITPEIMPVQGKLAEKALPLIDQQLQGQPGSTVLLVSDGVNPATIKQYQAYFAGKPYQLLILAAGNTDIVSNNPMDLDSLQKLASQTNGRLVEVTVDNSDIEQLNRYVERNMQLNGESSMPWKDMGYQLLFPIALIMMLWFRKGWLVQWCVIAMVSGTLLMPTSAMAENISVKAEQTQVVQKVTTFDKVAQWWWDLWLTPDQQGQRLFNQQAYLEAAKHFVDPLRKGTAYYYASEFELAHSAFLEMQNDPSEEVRDYGLYNAASALARQREYLAARDLLKSLASKPTLSESLRPDVEHNLKVIAGIVDEINQMSESQAGTEQEASTELGDNPQTAEGADEQTSAELMIKETLSADDILGSQELADKWLKRVEADPKYFLRAKFQIQLRSPTTGRSTTTTEHNTEEAAQ
ncbi:VWA domain-containing protein [Vibrio parahaemolyticus]|uniref:VWA domain-containing protein n=1 Tax=Vibrio parahaemolyticus TaxID=670 RepID=UPI00084AEAF2|nr:VWA domain-containing protein [Vibrio parahaemolyticus]AYO07563.1 VWA domain-containing protein [Vibrio parahaemolyticus]EGQ9441355.1 VWA domain-containing protein [Vibrio parahaemolyticus]EGR3367374.1 VWA domain-containing protein [Vibrio parahaemolyticus]EHZ2904824.1 VWA domain-containing protein [Vibrio parahaemolyticus]EIF2693036.1 VWA domain-containing protein [Vibrio parahaemolyticus]